MKKLVSILVYFLSLLFIFTYFGGSQVQAANDLSDRAEVIVKIGQILGLDGTQRETEFDDVPKEHYASGYIQSAVEKGIISGYPDGTFKPSQPLTRQHVALFIAKAFGSKLPKGSSTFKDIPKNHAAYSAISQLVAAGITAGYHDGTFGPNNKLTKNHLNAFMNKTTSFLANGYTPEQPSCDKNLSKVINIHDQMLKDAINSALKRPDGGDLTVSDLCKVTVLEWHGSNNYVYSYEIKDLTGIEYLVNLKELNLSNNKITDISALSKLPKLEKLILQSNDISDISPLSNLTNLKSLYLNDNQISDISALSRLTNLKELGLWVNDISDIRPIENLKKLEKLSIQDNTFTDITALKGLTNLKVLTIEGNNISNISALSNLVNLEELSFYSNKISDISVLKSLKKLKTLYISDNPIKDISVLGNLVNLTYLEASDNGFKDISALSKLTKLKYLHLSENQISDITGLNALINLDELYLHGNQLVQNATTKKVIDSLKAKGVDVMY